MWKRLYILLVGVLLLTLFISCGNNSSDGLKVKAQTAGNMNLNNIPGEEFLKEAVELGMEQVELGHLAQIKGSMEYVRELGKMMETEYNTFNASVRELALSKNIHLPESMDERGRTKLNRINARSGSEFDNEYSEIVVKDHELAIEKFEEEVKAESDKEIMKWASAMIPVLKLNLEQAQRCQQMCTHTAKNN